GGAARGGHAIRRRGRGCRRGAGRAGGVAAHPGPGQRPQSRRQQLRQLDPAPAAPAAPGHARGRRRQRRWQARRQRHRQRHRHAGVACPACRARRGRARRPGVPRTRARPGGRRPMRDFLRWLLDLAGRFVRTLDWPLCLALAGLMAFGLAVLYSAGGPSGGAALVKAQGARFALGVLAMWALSRVSVIRLRAWSPIVYALSLLPLLAVLLVGTGKHGRHWLNLGVFYLQPSELLKIALPMMVAWYLHSRPLPPRVPTVLATGVLIAVPTGLILLQPDFGTAM